MMSAIFLKNWNNSPVLHLRRNVRVGRIVSTDIVPLRGILVKVIEISNHLELVRRIFR